MNIIVTGGAGFIGSNFIFYMRKKHPEYRMICLDKLTYAGNLSTLESVMGCPNFRFVKADICDRDAVYQLFEEEKPESLITYVADRKGHDMRYAIDPTKIHSELGWLPETMFADGIKKTIQWYLDNKEWWETIISGEYQNYYEQMYGNR